MEQRYVTYHWIRCSKKERADLSFGQSCPITYILLTTAVKRLRAEFPYAVVSPLAIPGLASWDILSRPWRGLFLDVILATLSRPFGTQFVSRAFTQHALAARRRTMSCTGYASLLQSGPR
jgi:hypothetical protein